MTLALEHKRVVIIGGASGIGFAVAELAHGLGARVVLGSSREDNVRAAVGRLTGAVGHRVDLKHETSVAAFFEAVGAFDHLAITAGDWNIAMRVATKDVDLATARALLEVRFWGALAAAKHATSRIAHDGSITLTSGLLVHRPQKAMAVAVAMGGAVEHLARGLAVDLAPVRVNAVCPGLIMTEHVATSYPAHLVEAMVGPLPIPRAGTPTEAAQAYVYAMQNRYLTGQVLAVDGGGLLM